VHANDQLDKRRKFSESVLSGVYSGVIGLDKNLKINLPNVTATNLLGITIGKDFGKPILDIVPEFTDVINSLLISKKNVVEDKIYIVRDDKVLIEKEFSGWGAYGLSGDISSDAIDNDGDGLIDSEDNDEFGDPREFATAVAVTKIAEDVLNEIMTSW